MTVSFLPPRPTPTSEPQDAELMQRLQRDRDYAAFNELFYRHKDTLLRFLLRLSGDLSIAEDVSQQTWLKLIDVARQGSYVARAGTFRTWLYTLARNHFIDEYKRKFVATRTVTLPDDFDSTLEQEGVPNPADVVQQGQLVEHLADALRELPFEQREVVALWAADIDLESMMRIIGAPRETILSRKKYALAKLRNAFAANGCMENRA